MNKDDSSGGINRLREAAEAAPASIVLRARWMVTAGKIAPATIRSHDIMDIGFIGLGSMGSAMVRNLVDAGHHVRVWNRSPDAARAIVGATPVATPADAFRGDAVLTMLADDAAVRSVILDSEALSRAPKGLVHVMLATISIALVDELDAAHAKAGLGYVAAPVFGRPDAAAAAALNIVVAGEAGAIAKVQPLLDALGQKTWNVGSEPRRAVAAKLAGNMMIALAVEAMAEATALTESYGVGSADFLDLVTNTIFASPVYKNYGGAIAKNVYEPAGFKLRLGLKDVNLALAAADAKHAPLPAAGLVRDTLVEAMDRGLGDKDWAALAEVVHLRAGITR